MDCYHVTLHGGITGRVEVSSDGIIISADQMPVLRKAIGLRFRQFSAWVGTKGGEIHPVRKSLFEVGGKWTNES